MSEFEQEFNEVVGETQCLLELDEFDARMIFNAGVKAAKQDSATVIAELENWKQQALSVESEWDVQAAGKAIGVPLGASIRVNILPYITELQAENEALRKDAERYRMLRDADLTVYGNPRIAVANSEFSGTYMNGEDADAAIDAAIKGGE